MSKYGIIYKLSKNGKNYYGSTIMTMAQRMTKHRQCDKKHRQCSSAELFEDKIDPKVEIIETFKYEEIRELREREDYYIKNFDCINKKGAVFNREEYERTNKEYINKKQWERRKLKNMKEKMNCPICDAIVNKHGIYRHKKTIKCKNKYLIL